MDPNITRMAGGKWVPCLRGRKDGGRAGRRGENRADRERMAAPCHANSRGTEDVPGIGNRLDRFMHTECIPSHFDASHAWTIDL